jgi:hypothetical protein
MGENLARPTGSKQAKANLKDDRSVTSTLANMADMTKELVSAMKDNAEGQKMDSESRRMDADCKRMAQNREDIKLYSQLGMTEQVQPLLTMLSPMRKKLMEPPVVIPSVTTAIRVAARTGQENPSPLTLDTDSADDDNDAGAITLLETPVQQPTNQNQLKTPQDLDSQLETAEDKETPSTKESEDNTENHTK